MNCVYNLCTIAIHPKKKKKILCIVAIEININICDHARLSPISYYNKILSDMKPCCTNYL